MWRSIDRKTTFARMANVGGVFLSLTRTVMTSIRPSARTPHSGAGVLSALARHRERRRNARVRLHANGQTSADSTPAPPQRASLTAKPASVRSDTAGARTCEEHDSAGQHRPWRRRAPPASRGLVRSVLAARTPGRTRCGSSCGARLAVRVPGERDTRRAFAQHVRAPQEGPHRIAACRLAARTMGCRSRRRAGCRR